MHFMLETIIAAHLLGVDPFDQPAVEEGKVLAKTISQGQPARLSSRDDPHHRPASASTKPRSRKASCARPGPGGQNVNKLSTAVQLRFDVRHSPSLPNDVAVRLMRLAGRRLTKDGVLVLIAQNHRTQERNRAEAQERLIDLIRQAAVRPVPRRAHQATRASKQSRIESKKRRSVLKRPGKASQPRLRRGISGNPARGAHCRRPARAKSARLRSE